MTDTLEMGVVMTHRNPRTSPADRRWFIVRLAGLIAILAVPIVGASYAQVSTVSAHIAAAQVEHDEIGALGSIVAIFPRVEAVLHDRAAGDARAERADRRAVDAAFAEAERVYARPESLPATHAALRHAREVWSQSTPASTSLQIDRALVAVQQVSSELDDDLTLETDPNAAVQYLTALTLQNAPRGIVAIRRTSDSLSANRDDRQDLAAIARIAANRAVQDQPLERFFADIAGAISAEPSLAGTLNPALEETRDSTRAFNALIDRVLVSFRREPGLNRSLEALAERTITSQLTLMRVAATTADRLIVSRRAAEISWRRIVVALSILAVILSTIGITLMGRSMARRDRIELASAKLESEKLRAELRQMSTERALRLKEAQFRSVFENTEIGIVIFELDGGVAQQNTAVDVLLGSSVTSVIDGQRTNVAAFLSPGRDSFTTEERLIHDDGTEHWLSLTFSGVYDDGTCEMVILLLRDTTEEQLRNARLVHAANHDGLTQIANRTAFQNELNRLIEGTDEPFALMYIDLDRFKPVNDTYGHAAGDVVLQRTAERLRAALAGQDMCARLGGDEFAALVMGANSAATLVSIARRIGACLGAPILFEETTIGVTASIGIAVRTDGHQTGDALKRDADRALYTVKAGGGNGHQIDDPLALIAGRS